MARVLRCGGLRTEIHTYLLTPTCEKRKSLHMCEVLEDEEALETMFAEIK